MRSIKPNKPKAMIVFYKILFPVREKRSAAVSLFPFRQISEFPTGAALLKFRVGIAVWCTLPESFINTISRRVDVCRPFPVDRLISEVSNTDFSQSEHFFNTKSNYT